MHDTNELEKHLTGKSKKIAVFQPMKLGNFLCVIPAIRSLKKSFPQATISFIGLPWAKIIIPRFASYFNDFIEFPGYPGLTEQIRLNKFIPFLKKVWKEKFDVIFQMQNDGQIANSLVSLFKSKFLVGFCRGNNYRSHTGLFMEYSDQDSESRRYLKLIESLGLQTDSGELEFPLINEDYTELLKLAPKNLLTQRYACIYPVAHEKGKRLPLELFAFIADTCAASGLEVMFTGEKRERELAPGIIKYMKYSARNLAGKTSLGGTAALIKNASLLVSNDTGISYVAAALKTPSVFFAISSDTKKWPPLNSFPNRVINVREITNVHQAFHYVEKTLEQFHLVS